MTSSHVQQPAEQKRCAVLIKQNAGTTYRSYKRDRDKIVIGCLVKVRCLWSIRTTIVLIGLLKVFVNLGNSTWQTDILMVQISKIAFRRDLWYGLTRFKTTTWSLEAIIYIYIYIFSIQIAFKIHRPKDLEPQKMANCAMSCATQKGLVAEEVHHKRVGKMSPRNRFHLMTCTGARTTRASAGLNANWIRTAKQNIEKTQWPTLSNVWGIFC